MSTEQKIITPVKEGWLKKRGARMHRWSQRYFALIGASLTYNLKQDSTSLRGTFDLVPGCILTEVEEDVKGAKKGKKLFSFWIVWPQVMDEKKTQRVEHDSDGEDDVKEDYSSQPKNKDLKQIVKSEVSTNRDKQRRAEEQLEKHHAQDHHLSMGMKVAAVAVGGVVVGALTAGIGLVPYITVVGITAVASGGAVAYQYRRPSDSRLILAADTVHEALSWKAALEEQIQKLEAARKPVLPESVDPIVVSNILGLSGGGSGWLKVGQEEGVRLMEQITQPPSTPLWGLATEGSGSQTSMTLCRRAQMVLPCSPVDAFLWLMDTNKPFWPNITTGGSLKALAVDDHVDKLDVSIPVATGAGLWGRGGTQIMLGAVLSRFWSLDDEGCYLITLSPSRDVPSAPLPATCNHLPLDMDAVLTVSPRNDHEVFDDDLSECLVTCTLQIDTCDKTWQSVSPAARDYFVDNFVLQLLLLRDTVALSRYDLNSSRWLASRAVAPQRPLSRAVTSSRHGTTTPALPGRRHSMEMDVLSDSRGVITTQPGSASHTPTRPPSRNAGPAADMDSSNHQLKGNQEVLVWQGRQRSGTASSRHGGMISRSHKVNAEAAGIRSQIATKEFELVRLEKMVRKQGISTSGHGPAAISSNPSQVVKRPDPHVMIQVQDLLLEIKELKIQYFRLTGVDYIQTGQKRKATEPKDSKPPKDRTISRAATMSPQQSGSERNVRPTQVPLPFECSSPGSASVHSSLPTTPAARSLMEKKKPSPGGTASLQSTSPSILSSLSPASSTVPMAEKTESSGGSNTAAALGRLPCPPHWKGDNERAALSAASVKAATGADKKQAMFRFFLFLLCFAMSIVLYHAFVHA